MISLLTFLLVCAAIAIICAKAMMTGLTQVGAVYTGSLAVSDWNSMQLPKQICRVPHTQLLSLPMEILTEILSHLEWDDVLLIRQVLNRFAKHFQS